MSEEGGHDISLYSNHEECGKGNSHNAVWKSRTMEKNGLKFGVQIFQVGRTRLQNLLMFLQIRLNCICVNKNRILQEYLDLKFDTNGISKLGNQDNNEWKENESDLHDITEIDLL